MSDNLSILGFDIGTSAMKIGVFSCGAGDKGPSLVADYSEEYSINVYNQGLCGDIDPEKWKQAIVNGCRSLARHMGSIDAIALSGTTPGMTLMDSAGDALYPAILRLDQRSRREAAAIIDAIGLDRLLTETGNMPVAGGCSLASILWLKEHHPDLFSQGAIFGHSNTYVGKWLTGNAGIDPSSASLTALYNTAKNDLTWNLEIAKEFGINESFLPRLIPAHESIGSTTADVAGLLGLENRPPVIIGGNDAVLAALSAGVDKSGDVINVNGTCEISLVCLDRCIPSTNYNVRAHVIPDRWLTLYVMNAGGKAFDWFREVFCSDMNEDRYYKDFLPHAIDRWLDRSSGVEYQPFLMGSRYSQEPLTAGFTGLNADTDREELAAALARGLAQYQKEHLDEIGREVPLKPSILVTGGAVSDAIIRGKRRWLRDGEYRRVEQSSLQGAAMLAQRYLCN